MKKSHELLIVLQPNMLIEGTAVKYKGIDGIIAFSSHNYVTILIKKGQHRSQDVKLVVTSNDICNIEVLGEK